MVAPTPVSALLHSSTMVKAGVYLVVRLSPVLAGSLLGSLVAVAGGFTFMAASAIAISQRNGKRVLAYSTIANLGLIVCCAGIGTYVAVAAAVLLMIFHAVSKGLLFLCMGTVEQGIGSRDIEDMQGLLKKMPFTTFIMVIGMISMMLPPFGVLITKWLAMETAVHSPLVLLFLIMGSAFTVFFWAKWIGIILTMSYKSKYVLEKQSPSIRFALSFLLLGVAVVTCGIAPLFQTLVAPYLNQVVSAADRLRLVAQDGGLWLFAQNNLSPWELPVRVGGFSSVPLVFLVFALVCAVPYFIHRTRPERVKPPYFGGDLANNDIRGIEFIGPGEKIENIVVHNYYLAGTFSEEHLTFLTSAIALAIILIMFGVSY
ncbi:MAG TPA: proton-conducting transporter membrane subunit, partial [Armatimonadota bacterium]|nr:proton-conducting transporter membrane subunit [Armatimonadota bacterium]